MTDKSAMRTENAIVLVLIVVFVLFLSIKLGSHSTNVFFQPRTIRNLKGLKNLGTSFSKQDICSTLLSSNFKTVGKIQPEERPLMITQNNLQYCMIRKNGSTAWMKFFYRLKYGNLSEFNRNEVFKFTKHLDPERLSFVILRNPYMRLLSGFNHWVRSKKLYENYSDDFNGFVLS